MPSFEMLERAGEDLRARLRRDESKNEEARWDVWRARIALQAAAGAYVLTGQGARAARLRAVDELIRSLEGAE